jgi:hypothetical protein
MRDTEQAAAWPPASMSDQILAIDLTQACSTTFFAFAARHPDSLALHSEKSLF